MTLARWLLAVLLALAAVATVAQEAGGPFADPRQEERFRELARGLRCLVCQGESILDSNADLAADLRGKVRELMRAGRSDEEIRRYMTDRYGDFVLFRPPLRPATWALWLGPGVLALLALAVVLWLAWRRAHRTPVHGLAPAERERLQALLRRHDGGSE